jgi:SAM-dependent methyltransferase
MVADSSGTPRSDPGELVVDRAVASDNSAAMEELIEMLGRRPANLIDEISPNDWMYRNEARSKDSDKATRNYFHQGVDALRCIRLAMLAARKTTATNILDFACGHGRVLRMLKAEFPQAKLTASDIEADAVDFCARVLGATPVYSRDDPAEVHIGDTFDLIWCGSLLTHHGAARWRQFLALFESLLRPSGLLVFTTAGRAVAERVNTRTKTYGLAEDQIERLLAHYEGDGFGYEEYRTHRGYVSSYGISLSSPAWVWARLEERTDLHLVVHVEQAWSMSQDMFACLKTG